MTDNNAAGHAPVYHVLSEFAVQLRKYAGTRILELHAQLGAATDPEEIEAVGKQLEFARQLYAVTENFADQREMEQREAEYFEEFLASLTPSQRAAYLGRKPVGIPNTSEETTR